MATSNDLRAMITSQLSSIKTQFGITNVYYQVAQDDAIFPHIVYDFDGIRSMTDDRNRRDAKLVVDIYDKGASAVKVNNIADAVEDLLDQKNLPQTNILPTIYYNDRRNLPDEDKSIRHIQVTFTIQNYERT